MGERIRNLLTLLRIFSVGIFTGVTGLVAQEKPPFPVQVELRNEQHLSFGAFTVDQTGGTVSISTLGARTRTGGVVLLNMGLEESYAIFDVYANPGTLIQVDPVIPVTLDGPLSGVVTLEININDDLSTGPTFITTQNPHPIFVGGTLKLPAGSGNSPGMYSASFSITLIHE